MSPGAISEYGLHLQLCRLLMHVQPKLIYV